MLKKHEDFEKSLNAQEEKIKALDDFATKLVENDHYASDDVEERRDAVSSKLLGLLHFKSVHPPVEDFGKVVPQGECEFSNAPTLGLIFRSGLSQRE